MTTQSMDPVLPAPVAWGGAAVGTVLTGIGTALANHRFGGGAPSWGRSAGFAVPVAIGAAALLGFLAHGLTQPYTAQVDNPAFNAAALLQRDDHVLHGARIEGCPISGRSGGGLVDHVAGTYVSLADANAAAEQHRRHAGSELFATVDLSGTKGLPDTGDQRYAVVSVQAADGHDGDTSRSVYHGRGMA